MELVLVDLLKCYADGLVPCFPLSCGPNKDNDDGDDDDNDNSVFVLGYFLVC